MRVETMLSAFSWCAGPAAAHAAVPLPSPEEDAVTARLRGARVALACGRVEEALARFDEAVAEDASSGIAHLGRTLCLAALGRHDEAMQALGHALAIGEAAPSLAFQFSRLAAREGRGDLAMDLLRHALQAQPHLAERVLDDPAYHGLRDHPRLLVLVGRL